MKLRLAYAHKLGIVLVDITQKCLIMNAPLSDLYAATSSGVNVMPTDRDISVQPYATNSILQQHYQSHGPRSNYGSSVAPPQSTEPNGGSSSGALLRKPHNDASSENSQTAIFSKTPSSQNSPQTAESNQVSLSRASDDYKENKVPSEEEATKIDCERMSASELDPKHIQPEQINEIVRETNERKPEAVPPQQAANPGQTSGTVLSFFSKLIGKLRAEREARKLRCHPFNQPSY